jgi:NAD(P)H-dependent flavin oxidoreductase YrpB (nitropropane dioxygenase family)
VYLETGLAGTVVTTAIDGAPQRVIRTAMIDALEKSPGVLRFPRAAANALKFRKQTGVSLTDLAKTGLAMKKDQELTWSQVALAANAPMLTREAMVDGHPEVGILPTGQVVGAIDQLPTVAEVLAEIESGARAAMARFS